jgi:hypothetical protein
MIYSILFTFLALAGTAEKKKEIESACAKLGLSAIYAAEKSHYAEYSYYSDSFDQIGYAPEATCSEWKSSVRIFQEGQEFLAESIHTSGERWVINDKKELKKE